MQEASAAGALAAANRADVGQPPDRRCSQKQGDLTGAAGAEQNKRGVFRLPFLEFFPNFSKASQQVASPWNQPW